MNARTLVSIFILVLAVLIILGGCVAISKTNKKYIKIFFRVLKKSLIMKEKVENRSIMSIKTLLKIKYGKVMVYCSLLG